MSLPRLLVLTDRTQAAGRLADVVRAAVDGGARAVVLREKDLPDADRARLADELRAVLAPVAGLLVVAGPAGSAGGSDAVHLAARDPFPGPRPALVGRSCHDAAELRAARGEGADWAMLSPVYPTPSKPGYGPALGPGRLGALVRDAPPVYALGGVAPTSVGTCLAAGAHGVAVMGAVMRDPALVPRYLAELRAALTSPA